MTGNRVLLSSELTNACCSEQYRLNHGISRTGSRSGSRRKINRAAPLFSLPLGPLRKLNTRAWRGARGANMAIWRSDLIAVDGFDSGFAGWGREDSDLFVRLIQAGVRRKDGRWATGVLHLWHPEADRSRLPENERRLDEVLSGDRIQPSEGLSALPAEAKRRRRCVDRLTRTRDVEHRVLGDPGAPEDLRSEVLDAKLLDTQSGIS